MRSDCEATQPPLIEWGVAAKPLAGQPVSGDLHVVKPFRNGILVAAVDALGHGEEAAAAAKIAVATLEAYAHESVIALVRRCHQALRGTRGVAMSIASLNAEDNMMTWLGVGNVEGVLLRGGAEARPAHEYVLLRGGALGHELPPLRASLIPLTPGDTLIFATDGIRGGFIEGLTLNHSPQKMADLILAQHGRRADDALVLVARYIGSVPWNTA
jgi:serine phosphatase RsbU (regulator of sigma subunit)